MLVVLMMVVPILHGMLKLRFHRNLLTLMVNQLYNGTGMILMIT